MIVSGGRTIDHHCSCMKETIDHHCSCMKENVGRTIEGDRRVNTIRPPASTWFPAESAKGILGRGEREKKQQMRTKKTGVSYLQDAYLSNRYKCLILCLKIIIPFLNER
ncbi:unnamed protein product [Musa acuminata subsp. burmannicoides]|uniref:(wild Malaysian banana) hypothetical protein n=1 Tax=Musa acuminata subsp. malaccensis TaxID=214687 RepID=A0A804IQD5_MUSAM|nr:unnamed protein product [Musa acuminata subsp. malaccensis]